MSAQHEQLRTILTAGDHLDDITRARMWSRIEDEITAPAAPAAPAAWKRTAAIAIGAVAAAATLLLVIRAVRAPSPHEGQLEVAADATLTTRLGPHARTALVGPAQLELLGPAADATAVRLDHGTLLAEFTGGAGRSLRIEAGDLVVEIVGTLFAVEVTDRTTCVSVAHGTVRVTRGTAVSLVTDREQLCSGDPAPHAIPAEVDAQLARHEQSLRLARANPPSFPNPNPNPNPIANPIANPDPNPNPDPSSIAGPPQISSPPSTPTSPSMLSPTPPSMPSRVPASIPAPIPTAPTGTVNSSPASSPRAPASSTTATATNAPRVTTSTTTAPAANAPRVTTSTTTAPAGSPRAPASSTTATAANASRVTTSTTTAPAGSPRAPAPPPTAPAANAARVATSTTTAPAANAPRAAATITAPSEQRASTIPPTATPSTAEELYRAAERALAKGDRAAADRALAQLVALGGPLTDQALYERARIAYQRRAWQVARTQLAALSAIAGTPLAEPGRYLDCRIAVESKAADAERCFTAYRAAYPRSPHDLDVLAVLAQLAHARGGCSAARPMRDELVARYPRTDHAAAWRSRCPEAP